VRDPNQQEEMLSFDVRQHERTGDSIEHVGRGRATSALLQPRVPGGADVGSLRDFFTTQARRTPSTRGKTERGWIELGATVLEVGA